MWHPMKPLGDIWCPYFKGILHQSCCPLKDTHTNYLMETDTIINSPPNVRPRAGSLLSLPWSRPWPRLQEPSWQKADIGLSCSCHVSLTWVIGKGYGWHGILWCFWWCFRWCFHSWDFEKSQRPPKNIGPMSISVLTFLEKGEGEINHATVLPHSSTAHVGGELDWQMMTRI